MLVYSEDGVIEEFWLLFGSEKMKVTGKTELSRV